MFVSLDSDLSVSAVCQVSLYCGDTGREFRLSLDPVSKSSMHAFHCLAVWTADNQIESGLLTFALSGTLESVVTEVQLQPGGIQFSIISMVFG